jgi:predicted nucleotidyltransferase
MASTALPQEDAVAVFVERVAVTELSGLSRLVLFGSVARGVHSSDSDIDILAVTDSATATPVVEERLRDLAYDVMLERGTVFSIHAVDESTRQQRSAHQFFKQVRAEGRTIYE